MCCEERDTWILLQKKKKARATSAITDDVNLTVFLNLQWIMLNYCRDLFHVEQQTHRHTTVSSSTERDRLHLNSNLITIKYIVFISISFTVRIRHMYAIVFIWKIKYPIQYDDNRFDTKTFRFFVKWTIFEDHLRSRWRPFIVKRACVRWNRAR